MIRLLLCLVFVLVSACSTSNDSTEQELANLKAATEWFVTEGAKRFHELDNDDKQLVSEINEHFNLAVTSDIIFDGKSNNYSFTPPPYEFIRLRAPSNKNTGAVSCEEREKIKDKIYSYCYRVYGNRQEAVYEFIFTRSEGLWNESKIVERSINKFIEHYRFPDGVEISFPVDNLDLVAVLDAELYPEVYGGTILENKCVRYMKDGSGPKIMDYDPETKQCGDWQP